MHLLFMAVKTKKEACPVGPCNENMLLKYFIKMLYVPQIKIIFCTNFRLFYIYYKSFLYFRKIKVNVLNVV